MLDDLSSPLFLTNARERGPVIGLIRIVGANWENSSGPDILPRRHGGALKYREITQADRDIFQPLEAPRREFALAVARLARTPERRNRRFRLLLLGDKPMYSRGKNAMRFKGRGYRSGPRVCSAALPICRLIITVADGYSRNEHARYLASLSFNCPLICRITRQQTIRAAVVVAERQGYYGSGGMEGGGGLQATDLRRRLESQCSGRTSPQGPRSLRHDGSRLRQENPRGEDGERAYFQASLVSGQPTCTGSRTYRRQEEEAGGGERDGLRRYKAGRDDIGAFYGKLRLSVEKFDPTGDQDRAEENDEDEEKRHRLRWCRRDFRWIAEVATKTLLLGIFLFVTPGLCHQDAVHITAILGESVVFNCHVEFPGEHPVPYVLQWEKKVGDTPETKGKLSVVLLFPQSLGEGAFEQNTKSVFQHPSPQKYLAATSPSGCSKPNDITINGNKVPPDEALPPAYNPNGISRFSGFSVFGRSPGQERGWSRGRRGGGGRTATTTTTLAGSQVRKHRKEEEGQGWGGGGRAKGMAVESGLPERERKENTCMRYRWKERNRFFLQFNFTAVPTLGDIQPSLATLPPSSSGQGMELLPGSLRGRGLRDSPADLAGPTEYFSRRPLCEMKKKKKNEKEGKKTDAAPPNFFSPPPSSHSPLPSRREVNYLCAAANNKEMQTLPGSGVFLRKRGMLFQVRVSN
ncbi:hypothetical protein KM043_002679 [Ampulex compressa]|nr:hypothetical protein KM043_002679 [Ampulex compressa]